MNTDGLQEAKSFLQRIKGDYYTAYRKFLASQPKTEPYLLDPEQNHDIDFWNDFLQREPRKGKAILQKYLAENRGYPWPEELYSLEFLLKHDLRIPDDLLVFRVAKEDWPNCREYLRRRSKRRPQLSGKTWSHILISKPQAADDFLIPWGTISAEDWCMLLIDQSQFADRCPKFGELTPGNWCEILGVHPELEKYCRCFDKFSREDWRSICWSQPRYIDHTANDKLTLADRLDLALYCHLREKYHVRFGLDTLRCIRLGEADVQTVKGLDKERIPAQLTIMKSEIEQVLSDFLKKIIAESDDREI